MKKRENSVNINEDRGVILVNKNIKIINQKHKFQRENIHHNKESKSRSRFGEGLSKLPKWSVVIRMKFGDINYLCTSQGGLQLSV